MRKLIFPTLMLLAITAAAYWRFVYFPERIPTLDNFTPPAPVERVGLPEAPNFPESTLDLSRETPDIADVPRPKQPTIQNPEDCISGEKILEMAKIFEEHEWTFEEDFIDSCESKLSFFRKGGTYKGVAYKWGGLDGTEDFMTHLIGGKKPGSYSNEGVISCATGIDCSGFIGYCWGITDKKYGTSTIHQISETLEDSTFQMETDMQRGDALNLAGKHIVLFDTLAGNGNAIIYEATGGRIRKVRRIEREWKYFKDKGYKAIRFKKLCLAG
ncbi:MAG: hypothetical protein AAF694_19295 [Bacteroidota bacterium]